LNNKSKCLVCNSLQLENFFEVESFPYINTPILDSDLKYLANTYGINKIFDKLAYKYCNICGHVFLHYPPNSAILNDLYNKFYNYPSAILGKFEPTRDIKFLDVIDKHFKKIISERKLREIFEIGCFDGFILKSLKDIGFSVSGCDPSNGADIGKSVGLNIRKTNFDVKYVNKYRKKYDILITRHFIEHVYELHEYINNFKKIIKNNGLLIIETPNINHFLDTGSPEVLSFQHMSLYSEKSLLKLLEKHGFSAEKIINTPENIIVCASKDASNYKIKDIKINYNAKIAFKTKLSERRVKLQNIFKQSKNIAIYGAGGFGISCLYFYNLNISKVKMFIDTDDEKYNKKFVNINAPIVAYEKVKPSEIDLVVIASMYSKNILNIIKKGPLANHKIINLQKII